MMKWAGALITMPFAGSDKNKYRTLRLCHPEERRIYFNKGAPLDIDHSVLAIGYSVIWKNLSVVYS